MKNSITASIEFYFKGERFAPSTVIDLDTFFQRNLDEDYCYVELAKAGNIGIYSYEFEVMLCDPICYAKATGLAVDYVSDGDVDWDGLKKAWHNQKGFTEVAMIANTFFNVENLGEHPKLAAALLAAYQAGSEKSASK